MILFEKLHPLMTARYRLDWLTQFKLTDIMAIWHLSTEKNEALIAAKAVNQKMSDVMQNRTITWGILDQQTKKMVAIISISGLTTQEATIDLDIKESALSSFDFADLLDYLLQLLNHHFDVAQFSVTQDHLTATTISQLSQLETQHIKAHLQNNKLSFIYR